MSVTISWNVQFWEAFLNLQTEQAENTSSFSIKIKPQWGSLETQTVFYYSILKVAKWVSVWKNNSIRLTMEIVSKIVNVSSYSIDTCWSSQSFLSLDEPHWFQSHLRLLCCLTFFFSQMNFPLKRHNEFNEKILLT